MEVPRFWRNRGIRMNPSQYGFRERSSIPDLLKEIELKSADRGQIYKAGEVISSSKGASTSSI
jgi:hypothetical protein